MKCKLFALTAHREHIEGKELSKEHWLVEAETKSEAINAIKQKFCKDYAKPQCLFTSVSYVEENGVRETDTLDTIFCEGVSVGTAGASIYSVTLKSRNNEQKATILVEERDIIRATKKVKELLDFRNSACDITAAEETPCYLLRNTCEANNCMPY